MKLSPRHLVAAAGAVLVAAAVHATSIVPPENLGELARSSDAVVLAVAGTSHTAQRGPLLFTRTSFRVVRLVAGPLEARERITVEAPGGELDGIGWLVPGSPRFEPGRVYLLFLSQKPTGEWLPRMMAYGILRRVTGRDGSTLLAPLPEEADILPFLREDGVLPEPVETYVEAALLPHLEAVTTAREAWNSRKVLARSEQVPFVVEAQWPPYSECTYMTSSPPYTRWPYNVSPLGQVTMYAQASGDPSISGGGFAEVQGAVDMWMGIPNTSLNLTYGGAQPYTLPCSGGCTAGSDHVPCANPFGSNSGVVVFNDPCNEIPDPACPGVLGFGGPYYGSTHTFDGNTWYSIASWFVVINNGAGCVGSQGYTRMMAHEMGHGLGFGHFTDPNALMYGMCCNNTINATDTKCAQYTYPGSGPTPTPTPTRTPTPTPTPPTSPPAAPTGVSASDGIWSDRVRITWNAATTATSYHVYRNTTNNSGTATDLGYVTGTGADDMSAVAGTTYYYWVKAFNVIGGSPFSSPDTGYRSTTPVPTPTPTPILPTPTATPTLPPAPPPVPTGVSATDGTFSDRVRVTWNASAGATSYHIYRNTTNDSGSALSLAAVILTSYDDSSASTTQVYWYWVRAFNSVGGSPYSASDSGYRAGAGPTPIPTPTPPTGLTAAFTFLPMAPISGQQVQFTDTSSGATSWQWTFGDGQTSSARNPLHTYSVRGTYTVVLRITGASGSTQTSKTITVGARARRHFSGR